MSETALRALTKIVQEMKDDMSDSESPWTTEEGETEDGNWVYNEYGGIFSPIPPFTREEAELVVRLGNSLTSTGTKSKKSNRPMIEVEVERWERGRRNPVQGDSP